MASRMIFAVLESGVKTPPSTPAYTAIGISASTSVSLHHPWSSVRFLCISFAATPGLTPTALATLTMSAFRVSPRKLPSPSGPKSSRRANSSAPFSLGLSDCWPSSSTLIERFSRQDVSDGCKMVSLAEGGR